VRRELVTKSLRSLEINGRISDSRGIEVHEIRGLLAEFCAKNDIKVAIRGLRNSVDFEYEFGMANINSGLGKMETIFIPAQNRFTHISSSAVRELAFYGADISQYVPGVVVEAIK
jgi:pantetheine-phosphate adenylyltransferase